MQNFVRRITNGTLKYDHITPFLKKLRWLPAASEFFLIVAPLLRLNVCRASCAPEYLSSQFIIIKSGCQRKPGKMLKMSTEGDQQNKLILQHHR